MDSSGLENIYCANDFPIEVDVPFHATDHIKVFAYFEILSMQQLKKINRLAAEFYSMNGYVFLPNDDFYGSTHPQERGCFIQACVAYYFVENNLRGESNE